MIFSLSPCEGWGRRGLVEECTMYCVQCTVCRHEHSAPVACQHVGAARYWISFAEAAEVEAAHISTEHLVAR